MGSILFMYLGYPIFEGKPKAIHFRSIADRIKVKLSTEGVIVVYHGQSTARELHHSWYVGLLLSHLLMAGCSIEESRCLD
jgi:hypothetical protein